MSRRREGVCERRTRNSTAEDRWTGQDGWLGWSLLAGFHSIDFPARCNLRLMDVQDIEFWRGREWQRSTLQAILFRKDAFHIFSGGGSMAEDFVWFVILSSRCF